METTSKEQEKVPSSIEEPYRQPTVSMSVFVFWIVPVIVIAALSRFVVDTSPLAPVAPPSMPANLIGDDADNKSTRPTPTPGKPKRKTGKPTELPSAFADKPTSYLEIVKRIKSLRVDFDDEETDTTEAYRKQEVDQAPPDRATSSRPSEEKDRSNRKSSSANPRRDADPVRVELFKKIETLREALKSKPDELLTIISLAESLRVYDVSYHDGGSVQKEAITNFQKAIQIVLDKKKTMTDGGEKIASSNSVTDPLYGEMFLDYNDRSINGVLCALYTSLGKTYFMANLFENAVNSYSKALEIDPLYYDAISSRGSSYIILGDYEKAATDLSLVMQRDEERRFQEVFTGLARILQAKESAVPGGWEPMMEILDFLIPFLESKLQDTDAVEFKQSIMASLNRLYHVVFYYHDVKTKNKDLAFEALTKSYEYKMGTVAPWNPEFERQKLSTTKQIFSSSFFPDGVGSDSRLPIFIIGFVRSGSTLLERVLDSHPQIVGTGEDSVFNGNLDRIRNKIVETSVADPTQLSKVIEELADEVVSEMQGRWRMMKKEEGQIANEDEPLRLGDKMLTNYYNVGFIHLLFPKALILHVVREPMDTIFSAYKHEFPPGGLDYTSSFESLAQLYHSYRELMIHWDQTLPGRVTHIRYEDMVHDMPNVAKKVIEATGLEWDESVLDFHKKKQAVNTLSTTQVRRGVYKDSLQSWRRYEHHLKPLVELVGNEVSYDLKTSLPGYTPPIVTDEADSEL